jgi:hypothetical protein
MEAGADARAANLKKGIAEFHEIRQWRCGFLWRKTISKIPQFLLFKIVDKRRKIKFLGVGREAFCVQIPPPLPFEGELNSASRDQRQINLNAIN